MIQIPTQQNLSSWSQRTQLDGTDYIIDFNWNGRDAAWYINLSTIEGTLLVGSIKLVSNRPLLKRFKYIDGMPLGEIVAYDGSGTIDQAGYGQLSNGVDLIYIEASDDLEALAL